MQNQMTTKAVSLPTLPPPDPEREEDTSTADLTIASDPDTSYELEEFTAMLGIQMQQVERARTEAKITIVDKTILTELEILMMAAKDAVERTV